MNPKSEMEIKVCKLCKSMQKCAKVCNRYANYSKACSTEKYANASNV